MDEQVAEDPGVAKIHAVDTRQDVSRSGAVFMLKKETVASFRLLRLEGNAVQWTEGSK